jgi:hypothetical protein
MTAVECLILLASSLAFVATILTLAASLFARAIFGCGFLGAVLDLGLPGMDVAGITPCGPSFHELAETN